MQHFVFVQSISLFFSYFCFVKASNSMLQDLQTATFELLDDLNQKADLGFVENCEI